MTEEDYKAEVDSMKHLEAQDVKEELLQGVEIPNDGDIADSQDNFIVIKSNETMQQVLTILETGWEDIENEGLTGYFGTRQEFYDQMLGGFVKIEGK